MQRRLRECGIRRLDVVLLQRRAPKGCERDRAKRVAVHMVAFLGCVERRERRHTRAGEITHTTQALRQQGARA